MLKIKRIFKFFEASCNSLKFNIILVSKIKNLKLRRTIKFFLLPIAMFKTLYRCVKIKKNSGFKYNLAIVSIFKNEAPYLSEWIEYHKCIGFKKFYLYNNDSNDNYIDVLKKYINDGSIDLINFKGNGRQNDAYNDCINKHMNECKYLAIIDVDEFIYTKKNLYDLINIKFEKKHCAGLGINWVIYGSSHLEEKTNDLVIKTFLYRSNFEFEHNKHIKTIINPRKVVGVSNPHYCFYLNRNKCYNNNGKIIYGALNSDINNEIRINHYFTKSKEEFLAKRARGMADQNGIRNYNDFIIHDKNEVYDDCMLKYVKFLEAKND